MTFDYKVLEFINRMWDTGYRGKMYLYTSYWNGKGISKEILKELDGFTFTLHAECTDADIIALKNPQGAAQHVGCHFPLPSRVCSICVGFIVSASPPAVNVRVFFPNETTGCAA